MAGDELEVPPSELLEHPGIVGHHEDRSSVRGELAEEAHEHVGALGIQRRGGLVEEPRLGTERQRPGDGDSQLLAAGERAGVLGEELRLEPGADDELPRGRFGEVLARRAVARCGRCPGPSPGTSRAPGAPARRGGGPGAGRASARRRRRAAPAPRPARRAGRGSRSRVVFPPPDGPPRVSTVPPGRAGGRCGRAALGPRTSSGGHGLRAGRACSGAPDLGQRAGERQARQPHRPPESRP